MEDSSHQPNDRKKALDSYIRYSSFAFQIVIIVGIGIWGGQKIDQWLDLSTPIFTLILALIGVISAMIFVIKKVINK